MLDLGLGTAFNSFAVLYPADCIEPASSRDSAAFNVGCHEAVFWLLPSHTADSCPTASILTLQVCHKNLHNSLEVPHDATTGSALFKLLTFTSTAMEGEGQRSQLECFVNERSMCRACLVKPGHEF